MPEDKMTGYIAWQKKRQEDGVVYVMVTRKSKGEFEVTDENAMRAEAALRKAVSELTQRFEQLPQDSYLHGLEATMKPREENPIYKWTLHIGEYQIAGLGVAWIIEQNDKGNLVDGLAECVEDSNLERYLEQKARIEQER